MASFSVIIPTFNRAAQVKAAIDSVLQSQDHPVELLVIDDGSTDHTGEVLASYGSRIRALRQVNAGPGAARNLGIANATMEYIAFLDSDDTWRPGALRVCAEVIERHKPAMLIASIAAPGTAGAPVTGEEICCRIYKDFLATWSTRFFRGSGVLIARRDALQGVGGFTDAIRVLEDIDLLLRLGQAGPVVWLQSPATVACADSDGSLSQNVDGLIAAAEVITTRRRAGLYPARGFQRVQRACILAGVRRHASVLCALGGRFSPALALYLRTLPVNVLSLRLRYLLGMPAVCLWRMLGGRARTSNHSTRATLKRSSA